MAYLGFDKDGGGGKFLLANCAHAKGGEPSFIIFSHVEIFFAKEAWPMALLNTPLHMLSYKLYINANSPFTAGFV